MFKLKLRSPTSVITSVYVPLLLQRARLAVKLVFLLTEKSSFKGVGSIL